VIFYTLSYIISIIRCFEIYYYRLRFTCD